MAPAHLLVAWSAYWLALPPLLLCVLWLIAQRRGIAAPGVPQA